MAKVYILEGVNNRKYYVGSTINLEQRLKHHFGGHTPSTKRFGRLKLVFQQEYQTLAEARTIERKLKKLKRKDYLNKIIEDGFIRMEV
jgi:predicted GIY-YIG superfamily endonuclease